MCFVLEGGGVCNIYNGSVAILRQDHEIVISWMHSSMGTYISYVKYLVLGEGGRGVKKTSCNFCISKDIGFIQTIKATVFIFIWLVLRNINNYLLSWIQYRAYKVESNLNKLFIADIFRYWVRVNCKHAYVSI